jgi:proteasome lid subunit RPN8/RPN11
LSAPAAEAALHLTLAAQALEAVHAHAAEAVPEECCGFLLGRPVAGGASVEAVLPARNEAPGDRASRYLISPEAVLLARRRARELGLEVVGYYHSHPDGTAEPSGHDLEHAWPATSYLIVPVVEGVPGEPRSWRLREDREGFLEERLVPGDEGPTA